MGFVIEGEVTPFFLDGVKDEGLHPDSSIIHWRTGEPEECGSYLIARTCGDVEPDVYKVQYDDEGNPYKGWEKNERRLVAAWCELKDVKPYRKKI